MRSILGLPHIGTDRTWSTEVTPAHGDNEKHATAGERNACHNRSRRTHLEGRDLSGDKPDTGKQNQQEADLGECDTRLVAEDKHESDGEFAPAAHAGPIGHGDQFLELRAAVAARPSLDAAVCLVSALLAQGLTDRAPERLEVAVKTGASLPVGLRRAPRVVVFDANLPPERSRGVPVHLPATILVHIPARPSEVRGWTAIADTLPELIEVITPADIDGELAGRPRSVRVRLAYLTQGVAPDLAARLVPPNDGGRSAPKV